MLFSKLTLVLETNEPSFGKTLWSLPNSLLLSLFLCFWLMKEYNLPLTLMEHFTVILSFSSLPGRPKDCADFFCEYRCFPIYNCTNSDIRPVIKQITGLKVKTKKVSKANFQGFFSEEVRHDVRIHLGHAVTYKTVGKCI